MIGRYGLKSLFWLLFSLSLVYGCDQQQQATAAKETEEVTPPAGTIIAVGNSLTAGQGVDEKDAYPALLEKELSSRGYRYRVINGGISGETSSGALSRIEWVISFKPDIVILETGANDGLRGIDPELTKQNIGKIISELQEAGISIIFCGMKMVRNLGEVYTDQFEQIYPSLAEKYQVGFMPFFLKGVAGEPGLNQKDGIHPNEKGYKIIVRNLLPYVLETLKAETSEPATGRHSDRTT